MQGYFDKWNFYFLSTLLLYYHESVWSRSVKLSCIEIVNHTSCMHEAWFIISIHVSDVRFQCCFIAPTQLHKNLVCLPKYNVHSSSRRYIQQIKYSYFLCSVNSSSPYNCVKKNQHDAQLILSIFRQPLHVSGVSRPIIRRYNRIYTTLGTYYSF